MITNNSNNNDIIIIIFRYSIRPSLAVNSWKPLWVRLQDKTTESTNWFDITNWSTEWLTDQLIGSTSPTDQLTQFENLFSNPITGVFSSAWKNKTAMRFVKLQIYSLTNTHHLSSFFKILSIGLLIWHQAPNS